MHERSLFDDKNLKSDKKGKPGLNKEILQLIKSQDNSIKSIPKVTPLAKSYDSKGSSKE